ncbi:9777_t:CDS:2 [Entrophospora sp. SA101]|nr:9777_t:CDS:2 [Entrophospora sp. SA101]
MTTYYEKVKESVISNETFQNSTREIGRVANDVTSEIQKVAAKNNINSPLPSDFVSEVDKAASILSSFTDKSGGGLEMTIPKKVIQEAKGLAIFTVFKAGLFWSGRAGSGIVIARTQDNTWSPPSCINIAGVGFGAQFGADVTNFVIILNTDKAVKAFSSGDNVTLGGVSAGPIGMGTEVSSSVYEPSALYSYSSSKGFFAGVSVEGTIIMERKDANKKFYGRDISAAEILSGKGDLTSLSTKNDLYDVLKRAEGRDGQHHEGKRGKRETKDGQHAEAKREAKESKQTKREAKENKHETKEGHHDNHQ